MCICNRDGKSWRDTCKTAVGWIFMVAVVVAFIFLVIMNVSLHSI